MFDKRNKSFSGKSRSQRITRVGATALTVAVLTLGVVSAAQATGPNYATNTEQFQLVYNGHVQIRAYYLDPLGGHAKNGWLRYYIPTLWDTGRQYTPNASSTIDNRILVRDYTFQDVLDPNAPSTQFSSGFTWFPGGIARSPSP